MPISRKLKGFTFSEFKELLRECNNHIPSVAERKQVTPRAMQYWIEQHCRKTITYEEKRPS